MGLYTGHKNLLEGLAVLYCLECGKKWEDGTACPECGGTLLAQDAYIAELKKRAGQDDADAQNRLGVAHITGEGVERGTTRKRRPAL